VLCAVAETNARGSTLLRERSGNVDLQAKLRLFKHVDTVQCTHSGGYTVSLSQYNHLFEDEVICLCHKIALPPLRLVLSVQCNVKMGT
jgi:hypothetical protein